MPRWPLCSNKAFTKGKSQNAAALQITVTAAAPVQSPLRSPARIRPVTGKQRPAVIDFVEDVAASGWLTGSRCAADEIYADVSAFFVGSIGGHFAKASAFHERSDRLRG